MDEKHKEVFCVCIRKLKKKLQMDRASAIRFIFL